MFAADSSIVVALILSTGAFAGVVATGAIGWLSNRKSKEEELEEYAARHASVIEIAQRALGKTITMQRAELDRQDEELVELRGEVRTLTAEVRRLEREVEGLRGRS